MVSPLIPSSTPSKGGQPNADDVCMLQDVSVPASLRLAVVSIPYVEKLLYTIEIVNRYQWDDRNLVITVDYDRVQADMLNLESKMVLYCDVEAQMNMAYKNMDSNRKTIFAYHFQRLRKLEEERYHEQLLLYREKKIPKPERTTDSLIKAECEVLLSMLNYPSELNRLQALASQVGNLIERCKGLTIGMSQAIKRAESRGQ